MTKAVGPGTESGATTHTTSTVDDPRVIDFRALLLDELGYVDGEFVAIGHAVGGEKLHTRVLPPRHAPAVVMQLPTDANIYFGVNPTAGPAREGGSRGTEADITRLAALVADLDVAPGKCADLGVAKAIVGDLTATMGTRPRVSVLSGHGVHAYWPIANGWINDTFTVGHARSLARRWGRLVAAVAADHGAKADSVFDLARMLRVPGTFNCKPVPS